MKITLCIEQICLIFLLAHSASLPAQQLEIKKLHDEHNIHDIEVVNDREIYLYTYGTGKIFKTSNRGKDWKIIAQLDSVYYEQIQFVGRKTGYIAGEDGSIFKTADNGNSWTDVSIRTSHGKLLLYGMYFRNKNEGIVTGAVLNNRTLSDTIFSTLNGGKTWVGEKSPDRFLVVIKPGRGHSLWAATGNGEILRKDKKIKAWTTVFKDTTKNIGAIRSLTFTDDARTVIAASFNGYIMRQSEEGMPWQVNQITTNRIRDVQFVNGETWIAAGDSNANPAGNIYISRDAGLTWSTFEKKPDVHRMAKGKKYLWLVGKEGLIAKVRR